MKNAFKIGTGLLGVLALVLLFLHAAVVPSGMIILTLSNCPLGFTEESTLSGKMLLGTVAANNDVTGTGGNDSITPAGSVSAPTFTGSAGTVPAQTFTGSSATTSATSGGTPAGTISALTTGADSSTTGGVAKAIAQTPTFTGSALATHTHTLTATGTNGTAAFTPAGTNSVPTFSGNSFDPHPTYVKVIFCKAN